MDFTPSGLPFMEETDPLADVANAIEELATALSPRAVAVARPAVFSIPNNAYTPVPMTQEESDTHGQAALGGGVYTITLTEAGLYMLSAHVGIASGAAIGAVRGARIMAGASQAVSAQVPGANANIVLNLSTLWKITLATTISLEVFQDTGAARNTFGGGGSDQARLSAIRVQKAT